MMDYLWFGLFDVAPNAENPDVLEGAKGAFVNVVGLAEGKAEFVSFVENAVRAIGLEVLACEEVDLLETMKVSGNKINDELMELVDEVSDGSPIVFDEFQAYMGD